MTTYFPISALKDTMADNPTDLLVITSKANQKTYKAGSKFMNVRFNLNVPRGNKVEGWFRFTDVLVSRGIQSPDEPNEYGEKARLQVTTTISKAGETGAVIADLHKQWLAWVAVANRDGTLNSSTKKVTGLITDVCGEQSKTPGAVIEDPFIRFKLEFGKFLFGDLKNTPQLVVYDYSKPYKTDTGMTKYRELTVRNSFTGEDESVNENNVHLIFTQGAMIRHGRFQIGSVPVTSGTLSIQMYLRMAVVELKVLEIDDEFDDNREGVPAAPRPMTETTTTTAETTTLVVEPPVVVDADIMAALNDI